MASQSFNTIKVALFDHLEQSSGKKVAHNHKVATHIGPGKTALDGYLNVVNDLPLFRFDGLFLAPRQIPPNADVDQLLAVVVQNYSDRGWLVTVP